MIAGAPPARTPTAPRGLTFQPDIYPKVLSLLPAAPGSRVLDVGAGEGYFCQQIKRRGFTVEACGHPASEGEGGVFAASAIPFHDADLNVSIPLPDESFDCVVATEVIEHLQNHFRFVEELLRVTRKGGSIIITTPNVLSLPGRWHFFLYGYTDCAPRPLDPTRDDHSMEHINPVSLPQLLFLLERSGAELVHLTTNRIRRSAWIPTLLFYPIMALALRWKLLRKRDGDLHPLYRRHIRWVLHPANLMGRITIAVARRVR